jgi:hypothetical protein
MRNRLTPENQTTISVRTSTAECFCSLRDDNAYSSDQLLTELIENYQK